MATLDDLQETVRELNLLEKELRRAMGIEEWEELCNICFRRFDRDALIPDDDYLYLCPDCWAKGGKDDRKAD